MGLILYWAKALYFPCQLVNKILFDLLIFLHLLSPKPERIILQPVNGTFQFTKFLLCKKENSSNLLICKHRRHIKSYWETHAIGVEFCWFLTRSAVGWSSAQCRRNLRWVSFYLSFLKILSLITAIFFSFIVCNSHSVLQCLVEFIMYANLSWNMNFVRTCQDMSPINSSLDFSSLFVNTWFI